MRELALSLRCFDFKFQRSLVNPQFYRAFSVLLSVHIVARASVENCSIRVSLGKLGVQADYFIEVFDGLLVLAELVVSCAAVVVVLESLRV